VQQVVDDALKSSAEVEKKTTMDADAKIKKAAYALSAYEKKYHLRETVTQRMSEAEEKDKSSLKILNRLNVAFRVRKYLDLCFATY
jgi:hypothetical protein